LVCSSIFGVCVCIQLIFFCVSNKKCLVLILMKYYYYVIQGKASTAAGLPLVHCGDRTTMVFDLPLHIHIHPPTHTHPHTHTRASYFLLFLLPALFLLGPLFTLPLALFLLSFSLLIVTSSGPLGAPAPSPLFLLFADVKLLSVFFVF